MVVCAIRKQILLKNESQIQPPTLEALRNFTDTIRKLKNKEEEEEEEEEE